MDRAFRYCALGAQATLVIFLIGGALLCYIYVTLEIQRRVAKFDAERRSDQKTIWSYIEAFPRAIPIAILQIYLDQSAFAMFPYYMRIAGIKSRKARYVYPLLHSAASVWYWWAGYLPTVHVAGICNVLILQASKINERAAERKPTFKSRPIGDIKNFEDLENPSKGFHFNIKHSYEPLQQERSIHILLLEHSAHFNAPLRCSLVECPLDDAPQYTALSYAWDSQGGTTPVICDLMLLEVTRNCARALHQIRDMEGRERRMCLWVDAICIDQGPSTQAVKERTQQIQIMGDIYKKATRVIAWIGPHERTSTSICDFMICVGRTFEDNHDDEIAWKEAKEVAFREARQWIAFTDRFREFFERSWFTRMWPIQEVALPYRGRVKLLCGDTIMPWEYVRVSWQVLAEIGPLAGSFRLDQAVALQFYLSDALALKRSSSPNQSIRNVGRPLISDLSQLSLTSIMHATRFKCCAYAKDKFFALYAILQELEIPHKVDVRRYANMSETEAYLLVFRSCLANDRSLDILRLAQATGHYTSDDDFWRYRLEPYDSIVNMILPTIGKLSSVWQHRGKTTPQWRATLPSWIPDWKQCVSFDLGERDIVLTRWYVMGEVPRRTGSTASASRPPSKTPRKSEKPSRIRLRRTQQAAEDTGRRSSAVRINLEIQAKIIGEVSSVGTVDSLALLWQLVSTIMNFYDYRRGWNAAWLEETAKKRPFFQEAPNAFVAAVIQSVRNAVFNSLLAQVTLTIRILYRTTGSDTMWRYWKALIWSWALYPHLKGLTCSLHPSVPICVAQGNGNEQSAWRSCIFPLLWFYSPNERLQIFMPFKHQLKEAMPTLICCGSILVWQFRGSIYVAMYGEEVLERMDILWFDQALSASFICQPATLAAAYVGDDILILGIRIIQALALLGVMLGGLLYTRLRVLLDVGGCAMLIYAARCVRGTLGEVLGSTSFKKRGAFTSSINFFSTDTGLTGSSSGPVEPFDVVALVDWCSDLMILRKAGKEYEVVGVAYIGNKSRGELEKNVDTWSSVCLK